MDIEDGNETLYIQNLNEKIKPSGNKSNRHEAVPFSAFFSLR